MAVEVEPSHQHSITFGCCAAYGSRAAVWQNGVWQENAYEGKVCHWIPPSAETGTQWHLLMLAECWWRPNSGCEHSGAFQQQWQRCERQAAFWTAMEIFMSAECGLLFITGKNIQLMGVTILKKQCFVTENLLCQVLLLCSSYLCCNFYENK